jgi:hypothetical protein
MTTMDAPDQDSELVFHYTRAATALEHILETMMLRLNSISDTNDPWESRRELTGFSARRRELPDFAAWDEIDRHVKRARVACFCREDGPASRDPTALDFPLPWVGWARDRMWAQYADGHRGLCLAFDRRMLIDSFNKALASRGERLAENVTYSDDAPSLSYDNDRLHEVGTEAYKAEYRRQHAHVRYLRKRKDWEGEREFRLVLLDDLDAGPDAHVPIDGALVYVMMGDRFPRGYLPCIDAVTRRLGVPAYQLVYSGDVYARQHGA